MRSRASVTEASGPSATGPALPARATQYFTLDEPGFVWMVDAVNVFNSSGCVKIPRGLVEGNVSDLTTGAPLNGAKVTSKDKPDENTKTFPVPDDPGNPGGFYYLFSSLTGSHLFTARKSLYSDSTQTVNVPTDNTVRQDFQLGAGHLGMKPT